MQNHPPVSIVIVTWNSKQCLFECLKCLLAQTVHVFEIILVDNGSTDSSLDELPGKYPSLAMLISRLNSNLGFAIANNIGARLAHRKWLALLNADAFPEPNWLENLLIAAEENSEYNVFASRQLQANAPELLDGAGDAYHVTGMAWRQDYNRSSKDHGHTNAKFLAPAPLPLYTRAKPSSTQVASTRIISPTSKTLTWAFACA